MKTRTNKGGKDRKRGVLQSKTPLARHARAYMEYLAVLNRTEDALDGRASDMRTFLRWAGVAGITDPVGVTATALEGYQRWLWEYRKTDGQQLAVSTQRTRLGGVKQFFAWLCRRRVLEADPASTLELPRAGRPLPIGSLSLGQVQKILRSPGLADPLGLRDRAILELIYSTGIRRAEVTRLELQNLDRDSRLLTIRQGKGRRDRVVPVGRRATEWLERYLAEVRPLLVGDVDESRLFLSGYGEGFSPDVLGRKVSAYVQSVAPDRKGGAHVLRRSCATHMLEGGADIRYIQQLLGHAKLDTTAIYVEVSIVQLRHVHAKCHPSERNYRQAIKTRRMKDALELSHAACEAHPT